MVQSAWRTIYGRHRQFLTEDLRVALAGTIGVDGVGGEYRRAGERQDKCRDFDHDAASGLPIAARYLVRVRSQIRSKMNCMVAIPALFRGKIPAALFQRCFVGPGKWFRPGALSPALMTTSRGRLMLPGRAEDDSMMLEAILLLLGVGSCALVLVAFWGSELLGNEWRRHRR